jgi:hypothetical protein
VTRPIRRSSRLRLRCRALLATVLLSSAVLLAAPLCGGPFAAVAHAAAAGEEQFLAAHEDYAAKRYAEALPLFRDALELSNSPNARLYVARCLRELGMIVDAYEQMHLAVRKATAMARSEDKYTPTRNAAAAELAQLDEQVAKVVIALHDPPPGARVTINGAELESARVGMPVAVAPGKVIVEATAPGREPIRRELSVVGAATASLTLAFDAAPAPTPDDSAAQPQSGSDIGAVRIAGFAVAGLGVAALVAFAVTGSMASSKFDEVDETCGGQRCTDAQPQTDAQIDEGKMLATVANAMLGVGAGLAVAGTLMIIFGGASEADAESESSAHAARSIELTLVPWPGGLWLEGRFDAL